MFSGVNPSGTHGGVAVSGPASARTLAQQSMAHDALGAHARDELGLSDKLAARPLQAALATQVGGAVWRGVLEFFRLCEGPARPTC
jgi:hypothetical protein